MRARTAKWRIIDWITSILVIPAAVLMSKYRERTQALPRTTKRLREIGVFPIRDHYYEPLFSPKQLKDRLDVPRPLPGLDFNVEGQLKMLNSLLHADELLQLNIGSEAAGPGVFSFDNGMFDAGDAEYLYQLIRSVRPKRIVEIGSGNSTKIARLALQRNAEEGDKLASHHCIEPYEMPWLESLEGVQITRKLVQDCDIDWRSELQDGDLLFIDSSHMIRPQGDVLKEFLEILPQLRSGVYVHVHDIFTPRDYPDSWVNDKILFWNEQYLLEALLTNSSRYEVLAALNFLKHDHFSELQRVCPYLREDSEPASFYMRIR